MTQEVYTPMLKTAIAPFASPTLLDAVTELELDILPLDVAEGAPPVDLVVGTPAIYADDEERSQDEAFLQYLEEADARLFVLETVRGLAGPRFEHFLQDLVDDLSDAGFLVGWDIVSVEGRKRLVIIGRADGELPRFRQVRRHSSNPLANLIRANAPGLTPARATS